MGQEDTESTVIKDDDDELPFFDASNSFEFDHSRSISNSSSVSELDDNSHDTIPVQSKHPPESQSVPLSAGLRRRRIIPQRSWKELPRSNIKNGTDGLVDFDLRGSTMFPRKDYNFFLNLKDNEKLNDKLNLATVRVSSGNVGKRLNEETNGDSLITSVITTDTGDERVSDESITVDSSNSGSNFLFTFAGIVIKAIEFQTNLLVGFVTFPIWLMYLSCMFLIDPLAIMRRAKSYMVRNISRFLAFCYGNIKWIAYLWIKRNKSTWKLCLQMGWGLLWSAYVGFILVGLLVLAFVISGAIMKCIMEEPIRKIEQLNFDYTRETPTAFVPIMSCLKPSFLECGEKFKLGNTAQSRVIPLDHKLQATVSLTMPESDYNRNLGIFQVRVDFLSSNGKPLTSTAQPCMLQFKSQPIRLLWTFFKLAPLIMGYSSESQTVDMKFRGHTEREVPTSCLRVVMEPRAEFARGGGVPEIYTAYLKLESQLPLLKRILWSWKATVYVWTSIVMFTLELLFTLLCCTPIIVPWLQPSGSPSNNNASQNTCSGWR